MKNRMQKKTEKLHVHWDIMGAQGRGFGACGLDFRAQRMDGSKRSIHAHQYGRSCFVLDQPHN